MRMERFIIAPAGNFAMKSFADRAVADDDLCSRVLEGEKCLDVLFLGQPAGVEQNRPCILRPVFRPWSEEVKIDASDAEIGFYEDGLQLEEILQEQILLTLPMQRVCSETCKGICPGCGKNRNETACDCKPKADDRWEALRKLQL